MKSLVILTILLELNNVYCQVLIVKIGAREAGDEFIAQFTDYPENFDTPEASFRST